MGPAQYRRLTALTVLLVLGFGAVAARLVEIQYRQHETLDSVAQDLRKATVVEAPLRGSIADRQGVLLAQSAPAKTVVADPSLVETNQGLLARHLAKPLGLEPARLMELLQVRKLTNSQGVVRPLRYVVLQKRVAVTNWLAVKETLRTLPVGEDEAGISDRERRRRLGIRRRLAGAIGTSPVDDQVRHYPGGSLAAHVLGYVGYNPSSATNRWVDPTVGVEGLERSLDSVLRGVQGWQEYERVRRGHRVFVEEGGGASARPGLNVVLTLDSTLQRMVETELQAAVEKYQPLSASCVVVQPRTGEILALANVPTFDPNCPGKFEPDARRNRVILDEHEPGSTFKVISVSGALDAGVVSLEDLFDCERGRFVFAGMRMGDVHPNGLLSVGQIIAKSSNIGAGKVGIRMGKELLHDTISRFGIGEASGIALPGERRGTLHPLNRWRPYAVAWIPMGHEVATTPLQMTMAVAAVASGGLLMKPLVVRRLEDHRGQVVEEFRPTVRRRVIREDTARLMTGALKLAVEAGTGVQGAVEPYVVAGKTGTAEKTLPGGGYARDRCNFVSFIGFLPADDPQLCIGVFMDEPKVGRFGGETAAPTFRSLARQAAAYLGVPVSTSGGEGASPRLLPGQGTVAQVGSEKPDRF